MRFLIFRRLAVVVVVAACLVSLTLGSAVQAAPGDGAANGSRRVRQLAPGVETTIPIERAEDETYAIHDIVELVNGVPDLEWQPNYSEKTKTLSAKAKGSMFRRGIWHLQFTFKPLRLIRVDLPQLDGTMQTKLIWYMVFRVINPGKHMTPVRAEPGKFHKGTYSIQPADSHTQMLGSIGAVRFTPTFLLRIHQTKDLKVDDSTIQYMDRVIPAARRAIFLREQPNCSFDAFYDTVQISKEPIPVSTDQQQFSRWGVVTWMDVGKQQGDPRLRDFDYFTVQVMGLTNAYRWVDPDGALKPGDPPGTGRRFVYRTLQLNFYRPGDEFDAREDEIQLGVDGHPNYQWLYRLAPQTYLPARPVQ